MTPKSNHVPIVISSRVFLTLICTQQTVEVLWSMMLNLSKHFCIFFAKYNKHPLVPLEYGTNLGVDHKIVFKILKGSLSNFGDTVFCQFAKQLTKAGIRHHGFLTGCTSLMFVPL